MFEKIISGGQTGVDRAALDVALELGLPCGGWCPKGRRAEDGKIPRTYPLQETPSWVYPQRTEWNVRDSDGTLILTRGTPAGGTALTVKLAIRLRKPFLVIDLVKRGQNAKVLKWAKVHQIHILNVAGPRESEKPGIHAQAIPFLHQLFTSPGS